MEEEKMRIERITRMEEALDASKSAISHLEEAMEEYQKCRESLEKLIAYYESEEWLSDHDADQEGLLPKTLKRGVLTEDAVYDLLTQREALFQELKKW